MVAAPFAEFTWRHARTLAAERGRDDTNETEVARVLDDLLTRAQAGPVDKLSDRVAARTRVAAAAHRPPPRDDATPPRTERQPADGDGDGPLATVIPFGIFDADAEADAVVSTRPASPTSRRSADEPLTTKEGWRRFVDRQPPAAGAARPRPAGALSPRRAGGLRRGPPRAITPTCRW